MQIAPVLCLSLALVGVAAAPVLAAEPSAARYSEDVKFLASDDLEGRGNGTPELERAADYIADQFKRAGLRPAGEDGTFFQKFEITVGAAFGKNNVFNIGTTALKRDEDFVPIAFSDTADFQGPLVFAGYGITAPEYKYDDYANIDATDKIVVVFGHEPQEVEANSVFAGTEFTPYASYINKAINARMHGAKGIVFITDPSHDYEDVGPATRREDSGDVGLPAIHAKRGPILAAFQAAGKNLVDAKAAIDKDLSAQSFELPNVRVRIATEVIRTRKTVRNVMASLPGADPERAKQWIVLGGHYDHLGLGGTSSLAPSLQGQPHHGADDNASGTAGVLELARLAAQNKADWKRSVLFIAFAGEEVGLLGSAYFANHPTIPFSAINVMVNMDMIGRMSGERLYIGGVGTAANLQAAIDESAKGLGLNITTTQSGYGPSDHTAFNAKKVPVLAFYTGAHTDYHKPSDTADKINTPGALKILSLVYKMAGRLDADTQKLAYLDVKETQPALRGSGGGYGPYFGSVPDFRDDVKGVPFSDVVANSPAGKAGLKGGDIMIEFDRKPVTSLADYAFVLRQKKPGDVVSVLVKRGATEVRVDVTLEARK